MVSLFFVEMEDSKYSWNRFKFSFTSLEDATTFAESMRKSFVPAEDDVNPLDIRVRIKMAPIELEV